MKKALTLVFIVTYFTNYSQPTCTSTATITAFFAGNASFTPTVNIGAQYLCGPNTVVYDTLPLYCHEVYVDNNSTLFYKGNCAAYDIIFLKANCTLNILKYSSGIAIIYYEPGAIINNFVTSPPYFSFQTTLCPNITMPIVNCVTGLNKTDNNKNVFSLYPNPTNSNLTIKTDESITTLTIYNTIGESCSYKPLGNNGIDISDLANGIYIIEVKTNKSIGRKNFIKN